MKVLEPEMIFPGEEIVHITGYHWIYVFKSFLPFILILGGGAVAWALVPTRLTSAASMLGLLASLAWIAVRILDTMIKRCYVTNRRLINRSGWTKRDTQDVTLDRIGGIFLDQTPIERFLGYGRVRLIVPVIVIPLPEYLRNPIAFRNALYIKAAKPEEKPDDEAAAEEHDRQSREERDDRYDDDRYGAETVSLKELQEMAEDADDHGFASDLVTETDGDLTASTENAMAEAGADSGAGEGDAAAAETGGEGGDGGAEGGGEGGEDT